MKGQLGPAGRFARFFIDSKLTPLLIAASILLGIFSVVLLPREEEPQIVVPMIDVFVRMPGASAKEVEERATKPMEKLIWEIPGVEYIYSTSSPGLSMTIVRFTVGSDEEKSIVLLYNKLYSNFDRIPPGVSQPLIKPRWIDDVPVLSLTLWSEGNDSFALRRLAGQLLLDPIKSVENVSEVNILGGRRRQVKVMLDPVRLAAFGVAPAAVLDTLERANRQTQAGSISQANREILVEAGDFLRTADEVRNVVTGVHAGRPVYVGDVATVADGPEEPSDYVYYGQGGSGGRSHLLGEEHGGAAVDNAIHEAVTVTVAKRKGTNAVDVVNQVLAKVEKIRRSSLPSDIHVTVTRNYGETAAEKSDELLKHMLIAILGVTLLVVFSLGLRESLVVSLAIPATLSLTLLVFFLAGFTLNRITLFALIFSIGILVDDAIVVVENIVRHYRLPENASRSKLQVALEALDEVGNPTILATFTVIAAILPMAFVRGLMGPYMRPIPLGASAAMLFSLAVAFAVSPWASYRLMRGKGGAGDHGGEKENWMSSGYRKAMMPLLTDGRTRAVFLLGVVVLLSLSLALVPARAVIVKMLPFDNKSEFQVIVDMPEGTTLEQTAKATRAMGEYIATVPEVANFQIYDGMASPYNFNGLVRHYFLRKGPNVADLQVNLTGKSERKAQSHEVAKRVRPFLQQIAARYGANVKVAEVPPGPPVLQTLVAEVYGPTYEESLALAGRIKKLFESTGGVVDTDWYAEDLQERWRFVIDREKAALSGITPEQITRTLTMAVSGATVGLAHREREQESVTIDVRLPRAARSSLEGLKGIKVLAAGGALISLSELVLIEKTSSQRSIYHKNLMPVVYVTGDVGGREESPLYAILKLGLAIAKMRTPDGQPIPQYFTRQPFTPDRLSLKWDGEWHITWEVFRDLGIAFAVVLVLIYLLVVGWFQSLKVPLVIMVVIPLSLVGILPAHWLLGGFFTATSMIGFIAGAGIVVRNSVILVDFIQLREREGMPLREACVDAGAVRFRPMMLTAMAVVIGSSVILFDPIFQGMALSLMAGEVASLLLSRPVVPILYYLLRSREARAVEKCVAKNEACPLPRDDGDR